MFEELSFCHFPPLNTSMPSKDFSQSLIWISSSCVSAMGYRGWIVIVMMLFDLNILVFQTNQKQRYSFPGLLRFHNGLQGLNCNCNDALAMIWVTEEIHVLPNYPTHTCIMPIHYSRESEGSMIFEHIFFCPPYLQPKI